MSTKFTESDVFLSYSMADRASAAVVAQRLRDKGFSVFEAHEVQAGERMEDTIRKAIIGAEAVVVVLGDTNTSPTNVAFEVGAALAWLKPVYVVTGARTNVPQFLARFKVMSVDRLDALVDSILESRREFSADELAWLVESYERHGMPLDQLVGSPAVLDALAADFKRKSGRAVAADRIVHALFSQRKRGLLPRVGRKRQAS